jgi:hypothetical protein
MVMYRKTDYSRHLIGLDSPYSLRTKADIQKYPQQAFTTSYLKIDVKVHMLLVTLATKIWIAAWVYKGL